MYPFGQWLIKLIKMVIALVIFCTVVTGIAEMESMKSVAMYTTQAEQQTVVGFFLDIIPTNVIGTFASVKAGFLK